MRHAAKRDANHGELEAVFRKMLGDHVTDSSKWGDGAGDLFVSFGKVHYFVEIKRDENADYTPAQIRFRRTHPHAVLRCESIDQAAALCKRIRFEAQMAEIADRPWRAPSSSRIDGAG
jgi:hypothetical protein